MVEARTAVALVNLLTANGTHVARVADAGVGIYAILALPVVAGIRVTVVDVLLTQKASKTCGTLALVAIGVVNALGSIETRRAGTVVYVNLAHGPTEPRRADTEEAVDFIKTHSIVHTGITQALINIFFTVNSFKTWHTETGESSNFIQAGGIVLAWV